MRACITLDLEPDHAGRVPRAFGGWERRRIEPLLDLLKGYEAPLTIFVVAETLAEQPEAIERFRRANAEFHLHSYSHDLAKPDSFEEIRRGADAFARVFGHRPEGYRAPEGRISQSGWQRLEAEGFLFDSSIFPSFWPRPRYLRFRPEPFWPNGGRILELPISTVSPLRLIVSLSWFKLLGWPLYRRLLENSRLPEPLVFDMHMHDLEPVPAFGHLSATWRAIYARNQDRGLAMLEAFLGLLRRRGYRFSTLGQVARERLSAKAAC